MRSPERKAILNRVFAVLGDLPAEEILRLLGHAATPAELRRLEAARSGERVAQTDLVRDLDTLRQRIEAARDPELVIPAAELGHLQGRIAAALATRAQSGPPVILPDDGPTGFPDWFREMRTHMEAGEWTVALGFARAAERAGLLAAEDGPELPYLWQDIALVHYYNGRLAEAEQAARRAIREADDRQASALLRGSLRCVLGIVLAKRGDGPAGLALMEEAEALTPAHWLGPFNRLAIACLVLDGTAMAHAAGRLEQWARDGRNAAAVEALRERLAKDRDFDRGRSSKTFGLLLDRLALISESLHAGP